MKKTNFVALFVLISTLGWTEEKEPEIVPDLHAYGAEIKVGFKPISLIEGTDTILWVGLGASYGFPSYYHNSLTGDALDSGASEDKASLNQVWVQWLGGVAQGLVWNPSIKQNFLEFFLFYRGQFMSRSAGKDGPNYLLDSSVSDRAGLVQNGFLTGFSLNNVTKADRHGLKTGNYQEVSAEVAPGFLQSANVDFVRANGTSVLFYPLFDLDSAKADNVLSILFANFTEVDYLWGEHLPVMVQQSFGGRNVRGGLGGSIRGTKSGRFDSRFKAVNNVELRFNGPTLFVEALIPGVVTYFDAGYYAQAPGLSDGPLFSTGFGVFINIMNLGSLALYKDFWLNGKPFSESLFRFSLGLHF